MLRIFSDYYYYYYYYNDNDDDDSVILRILRTAGDWSNGLYRLASRSGDLCSSV